MATEFQKVKDGQNGKKQFQYFILASGVNDDARQNALILRMVRPRNTGIYVTLNVEKREATLYKTSLEALDQHFYIKKNIPFERLIFCAAEQLKKE